MALMALECTWLLATLNIPPADADDTPIKKSLCLFIQKKCGFWTPHGAFTKKLKVEIDSRSKRLSIFDRSRYPKREESIQVIIASVQRRKCHLKS